MKLPLWLRFAVGFGVLVVTARAAEPAPEIVDLGHDTYALTVWARTGFARDTEKLKAEALEDAAAYCAKLHKEMRVVSVDRKRPVVPLTGFAHAKVTFRALDPNSPELNAPVAATENGAPAPVIVAAPPPSSTDALYSDLMKLDDLRKKGILTEEEFQSEKKKLLEKR